MKVGICREHLCPIDEGSEQGWWHGDGAEVMWGLRFEGHLCTTLCPDEQVPGSLSLWASLAHISVCRDAGRMGFGLVLAQTKQENWWWFGGHPPWSTRVKGDWVGPLVRAQSPWVRAPTVICKLIAMAHT